MRQQVLRQLVQQWGNKVQAKAAAGISGRKELENHRINSLKEALLDVAEESSGGRLAQRGYPVQPPKGFLAVDVGPEFRRFVIPTSFLSIPEFRVLMEQIEEEFGFENEGALYFPCAEKDFEEILTRCWAIHRMTKKRNKGGHKIRLF